MIETLHMQKRKDEFNSLLTEWQLSQTNSFRIRTNNHPRQFFQELKQCASWLDYLSETAAGLPATEHTSSKGTTFEVAGQEISHPSVIMFEF